MDAKDRIIVAIDTSDVNKALETALSLIGHVGAFKFGLEFMHSMRRNLLTLKDDDDAAALLHKYRKAHQLVGHLSFDDVKLHDIPNTVEKASVAVSGLGVKMFNVHCLGGRKIMQDAKKAAGTRMVIGVTVLTSLSGDDLMEMGIIDVPPLPEDADHEEYFDIRKSAELRELVIRLAKLAQECGLDGVVCSPHEAAQIREACGPDFLLVTPGIRDADSLPDDQKRTMTAGEAIKAGADMLVIGRPITKAADPVVAARKFAFQINQALAERNVTQ